MSITDTSPAVRSLDSIVEGLRCIHEHTVQAADAARATADERIHALEVTAARLAEDLAEARQAALEQQQRADLAEAAGIDAVNAVAAGILREEALEARIVALGQRAERVRAAYEKELGDRYKDFRIVCGQRDALLVDNERLRAELDAAQTQPQPSRFGWRRGGGSIGGRL